MPTTALLIMAYGGPDSLDDIEPYLLDIRGGRPTAPELVEEIKERYAAIGGRSPLLGITCQQGEALAERLNQEHGPQAFQAFVGMRHWTPRIRAAVEAIRAAGLTQVVALVMAPHYSEMNTGKYFALLQQAVEETGDGLEVLEIRAWHSHPGLVAAIAEKAQARLAEMGEAETYVLFSAHSLPSRILAQGDTYADQLNATARLVAEALGLAEGRWSFCFQSAGRSPEPWLGPQIEEVLPELARAGEKQVLVVPVGFVADHVEVLYDIDIEAARQAQSLGMALRRSESLNTAPAFIAALAALVNERLERANGKAG